jgi:hypothetical protein
MALIEIYGQAAQHLLVDARVGFDKFAFAFEIPNADLFADRLVVGGQLRERRRQRLDADAAPA